LDLEREERPQERKPHDSKPDCSGRWIERALHARLQRAHAGHADSRTDGDANSDPDADVDLWFDAVSNTERYLEPSNVASMMVMGATEVGFNECRSIQAAVGRVDINSLPRGTYLCVSTNIKNTSVVRVNSIDHPSAGTLRLDFMTWHQP